jgi:hypothetical protein
MLLEVAHRYLLGAGRAILALPQLVSPSVRPSPRPHIGHRYIPAAALRR